MLPRPKLERVLGIMLKRSQVLLEAESAEEEELMKSYPDAHEVLGDLRFTRCQDCQDGFYLATYIVVLCCCVTGVYVWRRRVGRGRLERSREFRQSHPLTYSLTFCVGD